MQAVLVLKFQYEQRKYLAGTKSSIFVDLKNENDSYVFYKFNRDKEWEEERVTLSGHPLISKEELVYYRIFREYFPELACDKAVGHTRHL